MSQKLFILGLPGSGKSTIARDIVDFFQRNHNDWSAIRLSDYDILYSMFLEDHAQKHFYPTEHEGFYVKSPFIYDKALQQLETEVKYLIDSDNTLIVIEFARSNYVQGFSNFSKDFLQDAYVLFLDVDIETGMKRVRDRVKRPRSRDDHFVSKYTFEFYRQRDTNKYLSGIAQHLTQKYGISSQRIKIMNNSKGLRKVFWDELHEFVDNIMELTPSTLV